ncbi:MAG: hypothetical protein HC767_11040 [Akkermansiaceae bacterium]|nr:hypothetical protein [Akkermansiaceae bacterium]
MDQIFQWFFHDIVMICATDSYRCSSETNKRYKKAQRMMGRQDNSAKAEQGVTCCTL